MTKADVLRPFGGRKHVADFDGIIGNDDPVDEQLNQLASLLESGGVQTAPDTLAEILERTSQSGDFALPVNLGLELALLEGQAVHLRSQGGATALIFDQWHNGGQVSLGEPVELLIEPSSGLLQNGAAGLEFLWQPLAHL